ncbi:MAG: tetratricopeptide repeat protein [Planctomycetes bacterium]|nr:tetratricopeptide repeat protein [Planctomycetota bacterium]MBI3846808.1 tetratricopeptide repeat protein [Planctomycetota bacterium]
MLPITRMRDQSRKKVEIMRITALTSGGSLVLAAALGLVSCSSPETASNGAPATSFEGGPEPGEGGQPAGNPSALEQAKGEAGRRNQAEGTLASEFVEAGKKEYEAGNLEKALENFKNALEVQPDNEEAKSLFNKVGSLLDVRRAGSGQTLEEAKNIHSVRVQQARLEAEDHFKLGKSYYERGDYDSAIRQFQDAVTLYNWFPYDIPGSDRGIVEDYLKRAQQGQKDATKREGEARAAEIRKEKEAEAAREKAHVDERVAELFAEADKQFERGDYELSEKISNEILKLDYSNAAAIRLRDVAIEARHAAKTEANHANYREEWKRVMEDVRTSALPVVKTYNYPDGWEENQGRRKPRELSNLDTGANEEEQQVRNRLKETLISPEFQDTPLQQVVDFFHQVSGVNFYISKAVTTKLGEGESTVTFQAKQLPVLNVLDIVTGFKGLVWKVEDGVVKITTPEDITGDVKLNLYNVRDLVSPIGNFTPDPTEITLSGSAKSEVEAEAAEAAEPTPAIQMDRLMQLIQDNIAKGQWEPPRAIEGKEGTLIVRQTREVHEQIVKLLNDLRKTQGVMVHIESRFLTVEDNFLEDVGVDLRGLGDNTGGVGKPGLGTRATLDDFGTAGTGFGTPAQPLGPGTGNDSGAFYDVGNDGDVRARVENLFDTALGNPDTLDNSGGFTAQWSYLSDTEVNAVFRAVRKSERSTTLTAPSLTIANNQRAYINVINQTSYIKDYDVEIAQAAVIADPIVAIANEGVILGVKPVVSGDRKFITLEIRPTVAVLQKPIATFQTTLGQGSPVTIQLPRLDIQRIRATVTIPDNATLLIGGMKVSEERNTESSVPLFDQIPILSFLWSRKGSFVERKNLLILLKANIIIPSELEPMRGPSR